MITAIINVAMVVIFEYSNSRYVVLDMWFGFVVFHFDEPGYPQSSPSVIRASLSWVLDFLT